MDELGYRRAERNGENPRGDLVILNFNVLTSFEH